MALEILNNLDKLNVGSHRGTPCGFLHKTGLLKFSTCCTVGDLDVLERDMCTYLSCTLGGHTHTHTLLETGGSCRRNMECLCAFVGGAIQCYPPNSVFRNTPHTPD